MKNKQRKLYRGIDWETQRKKCLERDDYKCRVCNKFSNKCHHIIPWKISHDNTLSNLICLCDKDHKTMDNKFLTRGYTRFLKNLIFENARMEAVSILKEAGVVK